ncbi:CLAVATA3/ESR (CLE)-related protein 5 [Arachis ipaensis]|uniref:CLAVATA3/ESR (CLE)-related protein 5 n=1 Tax=Arachis ipaensis TaxID=130454 RepID=UPI0007AF714C|nr:CLAVATA3/ESR (CLE)-related protein 5 [Arachis ipaensis]
MSITLMMPRREFVILFMIVVIISLLVVRSEGRHFPEYKNIIGNKRIYSEVHLHDMVNNARRSIEYYKKRLMLAGDKVMRVSPAGPDPQHH